MAKIFNKNITPACKYCIHGVMLEYTDTVICKHKGIMGLSDSCRRYKYNPLNRTPNNITIDKNYKESDFLL